jgi:membrane associated rhomboid family serine protease
MFPLRDSHPTYKTPFVTFFLIVVNVIVFLLELGLMNSDFIIENYALIPAKVDLGNFVTWAPFITSQFLHAGFLHIISNMWFLKIFGDNVEERFGHILFIFIYLFCGAVGGFLQYIFLPNSEIPMLGASGAVAGVLGAYLVFFPHHKVKTLIPLGFFWTTANISAYFMLVYWFAIQLFSGVGSVVDTQMGGVAFWAHVGGFAAGYIAAKAFQLIKRNDAEEGDILDF